MAVVFAKTEKGQTEITQRGGGLHPRVRRVLILVDGKRSVEQLRELALADDLTHTLGLLEEEGYIQVSVETNAQGKRVEAREVLPSITSFRALPAEPDSKEFELAQTFMMNTLRAFCGYYDVVTLLSGISAARNHEELRQHFAEWYRAIVDTRDGRRRAEDLRSELLRIL